MKSIEEIRKLDVCPQESASSIRYFKNQNIDWDVYLPSKQKFLQRGFVWTLEQKRELIWSVLIGRHIPHVSLISSIDKEDKNKEIWLIIDGKQRLSSIIHFTEDKFTLLIDGREYLYSELPIEYQQCINYLHFRYYVVNEEPNNLITDEQKINWFKFINYAGTPQDKEYLDNL